jgi:spore coat protein U-like protein
MRITLLASASLLALMAGQAQAATATATLGVSVTIAAACTVSTTALAFGTQGVLAANVDQTGSVILTCTKNTAYNVGFDQGTNGTGVTARKMKGGATNTDFVNYSLFRDAARTSNWGNTVGTDTLAGSASGSTDTLTVYGRIPVQATGSAGAYTDTVNVTVTY